MRVLAAFDKFKGSLSAPGACDLAAAAIAGGRGGWTVDACPLSDGGEGFAAILTRAAGGSHSPLPVTGPRGGAVEAGFGIVSIENIPKAARIRLGVDGERGTVALVEMAAASGLALLEAQLRDPMRASSVGTGQLIRAAGAAGVRAVLLGVGGSATHDLGLGALGALGVAFTTESGERLDPAVPADWPLLAGIRGRVPDSLPPILIACDVDNPLLGPRGAARVYGPQKGLRPGDADALEGETARVASLLCRHFGRPRAVADEPGAGAAGGIAFGLMVAADARLLPGFDLFASWVDLDSRLRAADVVLTGEGRFDETSLSGKGPGEVARRALKLGKTVHVFAGQVSLQQEIPDLAAHAIAPAGMPLEEALAKASELLSGAVAREFAQG
jgi:glycerate 2-kinase